MIKCNLLEKIKETVSSQEADAFGIQIGGESSTTFKNPGFVFDDDLYLYIMEIQHFFTANSKGNQVLASKNIQTSKLSQISRKNAKISTRINNAIKVKPFIIFIK